MERALALFLAAQLAGCSFIGMHSVPPTENCTESSTLPLLDATGAVVLGGLGTVGVIASLATPADERFYPATIAGLIIILALATPLAISSWWGFRNIERCREARGGPVFTNSP